MWESLVQSAGVGSRRPLGQIQPSRLEAEGQADGRRHPATTRASGDALRVRLPLLPLTTVPVAERPRPRPPKAVRRVQLPPGTLGSLTTRRTTWLGRQPADHS